MNQRKIIVFGCRGYLGQKFLKALPDAVPSEADIADSFAIQRVLMNLRPEVVINCAGTTGRPNVDWCEDNKQKTFRSNVTGPAVLMQECSRFGSRLVHVGSGCIYYGDYNGGGFYEEIPANFTGSYYSKTKAWSDAFLSAHSDMVLNLRIRMPFDGTTSDRNLIMKLLKYKRLIDYKNSMTNVDEFVSLTVQMIEAGKTGTFNMVNEGAMSPYEVMEMYREIVDPNHEFEPLSHTDIGLVAKAPRSNCLLNTDKLRCHGQGMTNIRGSMRLCMESLRDILKR